MKLNSLVVLLLLIFSFIFSCSDKPSSPIKNSFAGFGEKTNIETQLSDEDEKRLLRRFSKDDLATLLWMPIDHLSVRPEWNEEKDLLLNGHTKWELYTGSPITLQSAFLGNGILVNPGDSILISYDGKEFTCTGKGANGVKLQLDIQEFQKKYRQPDKFYFPSISLEEYFTWKDYLDKCEDTALYILERYKNKISPFVYTWVKSHSIRRIEQQRSESFMGLNNYRTENNTSDITDTDMTNIFDSTLNNSLGNWLRTQADYRGDVWYFYQYTRLFIWRRFNFNLAHDSINTDAKRKTLYYNTLKQNYTGILRERLLEYVVSEEIIKELGVDNPATKTILADYYSQPDFPEYKQWVKNYEDSMRIKRNKKLEQK